VATDAIETAEKDYNNVESVDTHLLEERKFGIGGGDIDRGTSHSWTAFKTWFKGWFKKTFLFWRKHEKTRRLRD
ncbi:hypothetical protein L917_16651, partial [Phytophthora nicotianae]